MPTENDDKKSAAPAADARDSQIAALRAQLDGLAKENQNLAKENDALTQDLDDAKKKLKAKAATAAPTGDYCVLGGKTYQVLSTVPAKFAGDEGRKGHLPEGIDTELVVLKR